MMEGQSYASVAMWAVDFFRAFNERPWWARMLGRLAMGRYAYREFIGLRDSLERDGLDPSCPYELESHPCHKDKVPADWRMA